MAKYLTGSQRAIGASIWLIILAVIISCSSSYLFMEKSAAKQADVAEKAQINKVNEASTEASKQALLQTNNSKKIPKRLIKLKNRYYDIIVQAADQHNIDPALIQAIIMAESSFNPKAISKVGARGLMQLMPNTAKSLGVEDSFNPEHNIHGGVKYFRQLLTRYEGNEELALAAYNAGSKYVRVYNGIPPFKATKRYIKKVIEYRKLFQDTIAWNSERA